MILILNNGNSNIHHKYSWSVIRSREFPGNTTTSDQLLVFLNCRFGFDAYVDLHKIKVILIMIIRVCIEKDYESGIIHNYSTMQCLEPFCSIYYLQTSLINQSNKPFGSVCN